MVDRKNTVVAVVEGPGDAVIGGELGVVAADDDFLGHVEGVEMPDQVGVDADFG
ncbi:hypothetical protein D3C80_2164430 [compost metagenome]